MAAITSQDAVAIAKNHPGLKKFAASWEKRGRQLAFNVRPDAGGWRVICSPAMEIAGSYEVQISKDGKILSAEEQLEG